MKSFITALALVAIAEASWGGSGFSGFGGAYNGNGYGAGSYGGAKHGAVGNRLGATNFSSEMVFGKVDRKGTTPRWGAFKTSHYDNYGHGKNGWKAANRGYGDAGAAGKTWADEAADAYAHSGAYADASGHADAGA